MESIDAAVGTSRVGWLAGGLAAACAVTAAVLQAWAALALVVVSIGIGAGLSLRRSVVAAVTLGDGERVRVTCRNGREFSGSIADRVFVSPAYIGFRVRGENGSTHAVGLFRDAMQPGDFRRLAARLRYPETPERA